VSFCAICTSERGPFSIQPLGKGNADVAVCADCNDVTPAAYDSERGYEPSGGLPTIAQVVAAAKRVLGDRYGTKDFSPPRYEVPAGWRLFRVRRRKADGQSRDAQEAYETLRNKPWFGPGRVKYAGNTGDFILFSYAPSARLAVDDANPLEAIEQYRSAK
jgi:hypothetical protein